MTIPTPIPRVVPRLFAELRQVVDEVQTSNGVGTLPTMHHHVLTVRDLKPEGKREKEKKRKRLPWDSPRCFF